ncbi:MAG: acetate--CoA ligase family protein [Rhodospirillales bacterium]
MPRNVARENLKRLLAPRHIAVIGGAAAEETIRQNRKIGFSGEMWPVHPSRNSLDGIACRRRIEDLPEAPDAAFLGVPREAVGDALRALAKIGCGGTVCYAAGFAEVADGVALEADLIEAAGDMAVLGPNCHGLVNYLDRVALWPDQYGGEVCNRGVAIISQSGNIGITLTMHDRGLPLSHMVSVGNQAVLTIHDFIDALAVDDRVSGIGLYIEGIDDLPKLAEGLLTCHKRRVPVVAVKAGRTHSATLAAFSHTSSVAGQDRLYDAFFERYGCVRVDTLADLMETLKLLHMTGPLGGRRIGTISCSGGDAAMAADLAIPLGLTFPDLPDDSRRALEDVLGDRVAVSNPLDYHTYIWGDRERLTRCFTAMLGANFNAVALIIDYPRLDGCDTTGWDVALEALIEGTRRTGVKAIVVSSLPETLTSGARKILADADIPAMQGLPECMRAIRNAWWVGEAWRRMETENPPPLLPSSGAKTAEDAKQLDEDAAKTLLEAYGLKTPVRWVGTIAKAAEAATNIGYPVAIKTASPIAHKTEAGGIALSLSDAAAVTQAAAAMITLGERVLVEEMLERPLVEIFVGVDVDPQFGAFVAIGAGGVLVELIRNTEQLLLPVQREEVRRALKRLKLNVLLDGYRGGPVADIDAVVDAIFRIGAFAQDWGERLAELDVNPLMIYPEPANPVVADAFIRLRPAAPTANE